MKKRQLLKHSVFLLLFYGLFACQDDYLKNEDLIYDLDRVGKAFMNRLKESPDWSVGWKDASRQGKILPNEAALLYGGGYGWHYVLPLVEEKTVIGLVIYPIEGIGEDEGPECGRLGKPVVRVGKEASEDPGAGGFLSTRSFHKWQKNGLEISEELHEVQNRWGRNVVKNSILETRASNGYYYCFYEVEVENYIDDDGNAVIVGLPSRVVQDVFYRVANQLPFRIEIELNTEYVFLNNCTYEMMNYYINQVRFAFKFMDISFSVIYIFGRDNYGGEIEEYPDPESGSGSSSGGGGGGGGSQPSKTPMLDKFCDQKSPLTQLEKEAIENGINNLKQLYPYASPLFNMLLSSGIQIIIELDPNMSKGSIKYNKDTHTLTFINTNVVSSYGALEDWAHVAQYEIYYTTDIPSARTTEFEAKMFCDINCTIIDMGACAALGNGFSRDPNLWIEYTDFKTNISQGIPVRELLEVYYKLGNGWNDPTYQSGVFQQKYPELLSDILR